MEALRCLRSYCRVSRRLATKFPSNGRATGDRRSMQPQSRHRSRQWSVQNEVVSHRYSIAAPIARKICDRGRFLGSAARSFRRVSFGRTVAVTAIEHGNIVITVASLIRESGPEAASRSLRSRSRGGKRHLECQQITAHSRVEHVACIGQHLDRRRGLFKIAERQAPAGAQLDMQVHLDVENGREAGCPFAHVSELGRLVDRERVGASKFDTADLLRVLLCCSFNERRNVEEVTGYRGRGSTCSTLTDPWQI